jgi:hypothetical protein
VNLFHAISTGLWLVDMNVHSLFFLISDLVLELTLFFPWMIDWSFWDVDYLYDNASQVPGLKVSPLSSIDVCSDWPVWCCALDPWIDCVRHVADEEKGLSLYSGESRLPSIWEFVLCSKSPNFAHKRKIDPNTCGSKTRFPESRHPGKFDLWGSHSIFHILVVCAAVVQLIGYLDAFDYAHANLTCSSL